MVLTMIIPAITVPYLVRILGYEKFGLISFAQAFTQYFIVLIDYSFNFTATRQISIHKDNPVKISAIFNAVLFARFLFFLLSFTTMMLIMLGVEKFRNDWPLYMLNSITLIGSALFPMFFFQGTEKMKYIFFCNLLMLFFTAALFVFIKSESHYLRVPLITSMGSVAVGLLGLWIVFSHFKINFSIPSLQEIFFQLREGWQIFLSNLSVTLFANSKIVALGFFAGNRITGCYAVAEKMANLLLAFPLGLFAQALYPRLNVIFSKNKQEAVCLAKKLQRLTTLGYLILTPLLFCASTSIVQWFSGSPAPESVFGFKLLLIVVFVIAANSFRLQFCFINQRNDVLINIGIASFIGTLLAVALTYFFSYKGTAIAFLALAIVSFFITPSLQNQLSSKESPPAADTNNFQLRKGVYGE